MSNKYRMKAAHLIRSLFLIVLLAFSWGNNAYAIEPSSESQSIVSLPASIPLKRSPSSADASSEVATGLILCLFICVVALGILIFWISRGQSKLKLERVRALFGPFRGNSNDELAHKGSVMVGHRHSVHVIHWRGRALLLGCSEQGVNLICSEEVESNELIPLPANSSENQL